MSKAEAALIASRALCIYFIFWAIDNLTLVPYRLHEFSYHSSVLYTNHFARVADWISLSELVVRVIVFFIAAGFFYKCGPRLQAFFLNSQPERQSQPQ
jgi:hypothetical protein